MGLPQHINGLQVKCLFRVDSIANYISASNSWINVGTVVDAAGSSGKKVRLRKMIYKIALIYID
jgi:hypothetical protein